MTPFLLPFLISYYFNSYFLYTLKPTSTKFITFPITHILNLTLQTLLLYLFLSSLNFPPQIPPFPPLLITIPITFLLSKSIL
ncbi:GtrA family protein, partial [Staphylococcus aureus]|uniref:GtrA family protein n=1 Tax=Staphylococcus aureus TaxID=1280 RepID=UPI0037D9D619